VKHTSNTNKTVAEILCLTPVPDISKADLGIATLGQFLTLDQFHHLRSILKDASQSALSTHGERNTALAVLNIVDATLEELR
jgi:hypothetical protein